LKISRFAMATLASPYVSTILMSGLKWTRLL